MRFPLRVLQLLRSRAHLRVLRRSPCEFAEEEVSVEAGAEAFVGGEREPQAASRKRRPEPEPEREPEPQTQAGAAAGFANRKPQTANRRELPPKARVV